MAYAPPTPDAVGYLNPNSQQLQVGRTVELLCPIEGTIQDANGQRVARTLPAGTRVIISNIRHRPWELTRYALQGATPQGFDLLYELKMSPQGVTFNGYATTPNVVAESKVQIPHAHLLDISGNPKATRPWVIGEVGFVDRVIEYTDLRDRSRKSIFIGQAVRIASPVLTESAHLPKVSFSYVAGDSDFDVTERYAFWDSPNTISWFKSCGYTLYHRPEPDSPETCPALPFEPYTDIQYPYAKYDAESASQEERLRAIDRTGKVAFAQDSLGRHVVMKLVRAETDELRILRFLSKQSHDTLRENCVIPVLDLLPIEGFWFVVMPRWGCIVHLPQPGQLHEVITMMHSILKGLVFLHANGIAHHDIMLRNVLVDHFTDMWQLFNGNSTRGELRSNGRLLYALFDFDHSVLLPPGVKKGELRLPYWRSWGNFNRTNDTTTGEFDYDPFILDVGMLGVEFCDFFQHLTPIFPRLAPLLDMMTTRDLERRFTAAQALQFLEDSMTELTHSQSMAYISILETNAFYFEYDRWRDLRPEFVEKWKHYKEPPVPWTTLALRRLCWRPYFIHTVPWTRWFFSRLFSAPRTLLSWLWPSRKICI